MAMAMARVSAQELRYLHKCRTVCNKRQAIQHILAQQNHTHEKDEEWEDSFRKY